MPTEISSYFRTEVSASSSDRAVELERKGEPIADAAL
jgi:hypothetical protein